MMIDLARRTWKRFAPHALKRGVGQLLGQAFIQVRLRDVPVLPPAAPGQRSPIVLSAFVGGSFGIARAGELTASALRAAGYEVVLHDLTPVIGASLDYRMTLPGAPDGLWILHCNPPEAEAALARIERSRWIGRHRVGYWAWELSEAPAAWRRAARLFHTLWAPSAFTAESFTPVDTPVAVMPHPTPLTHQRPDHARFGLEPDQVNLLAMADLSSTAARKNPIGALDLFIRLFPAPQTRCRLVLKVSSWGRDATATAAIQTRAAGRPDIILLRETLDDRDMARLTATCDIVLSLHRSEGFGLAPAEAFAAGRIALCTGWSGAMTFMAPLPELTVAYRLTPIGRDVPIYGRRGGLWAEPDLDDAAAKLSRLIDDPDLRARLAERGRQEIARLAIPWTFEALSGQDGFQRAARTP